jgi:hypothetical protein
VSAPAVALPTDARMMQRVVETADAARKSAASMADLAKMARTQLPAKIRRHTPVRLGGNRFDVVGEIQGGCGPVSEDLESWMALMARPARVSRPMGAARSRRMPWAPAHDHVVLPQPDRTAGPLLVPAIGQRPTGTNGFAPRGLGVASSGSRSARSARRPPWHHALSPASEPGWAGQALHRLFDHFSFVAHARQHPTAPAVAR